MGVRAKLLPLLISTLLLMGCSSTPVKEIVYIDRPVEVIKEVETAVEVVKEVEVIKTIEVPIYETIEVTKYTPLSDWENAEELEEFLVQDNTDRVIILTAGADGMVELNGQCEDAAIQLIKNAAEKGKRLSFVPLHPGEYKKWYGVYPGANSYHAICGALVGDNEFYYIEPDNDKIWLAQYLD